MFLEKKIILRAQKHPNHSRFSGEHD
jgi:hypothetical protein